MNNKEKETLKKEEKILDKDFQTKIKQEDIDIKNLEIKSKLNETKGKMGEKVVKHRTLDNSTLKGKILRTLIVVVILAVIFVGGYLALRFSGVLDKFNSLEDVKNFILKGGNWSVLIFILIQILQSTILPIPAFITTIAGALIFGPWNTFFMSLIAIMIGSIISFILGRKFGKSLLVWIAGEEDANKWTTKLTNGKYLFFLMMLFPVFPDDILCIAAGVTNMSFRFFFFTNLITRPIALISICFLGSGTLIPFKGYGLIIWAILIVLMIVLFVLSVKYREKIENFVENLSKKKKLEKKSKYTNMDIPNISDGENEKNKLQK